MPAHLCCIFILSDPLLPCLPGTSNSSTPQELVRYANFLALLHPLNQKLCGWDLAICLKKPNPLPHKVIYLRNTALEKQERSSCLFLALSGPLLCSCGTTKQLSKWGACPKGGLLLLSCFLTPRHTKCSLYSSAVYLPTGFPKPWVSNLNFPFSHFKQKISAKSTAKKKTHKKKPVDLKYLT